MNFLRAIKNFFTITPYKREHDTDDEYIVVQQGLFRPAYTVADGYIVVSQGDYLRVY
jgi:formylmethanofuran dehydrogenase subunit A